MLLDVGSVIGLASGLWYSSCFITLFTISIDGAVLA